ncbi:hypothetical protein [Amycolatopsis aidingensis]|uniref:hypothetical protein n=1 Tax=Amycolatopsis aidingensis TaxID=2842453 RepID=UPI002FC8D189
MSVSARQLAATACTLGLAPLLLAQALRVRGRTPRLPGAGGPAAGSVPGWGASLRLLVLGSPQWKGSVRRITSRR